MVVDVGSIVALLSLDDSLVTTLAISAPIVDELLVVVSGVVSATVLLVVFTALQVSLVSLLGDLARTVEDLLVAEGAPVDCPLPDLPEN